MIHLYQNKALDHYHVEINQLGWSGAEAKYPPLKACQDTRSKGAEAFEPGQFVFYTLVAKIDATELEDAFYVQNNPFGYEDLEDRIERLDSQHSMSVGDIVKKGPEYFMVDPMGFTKIQITQTGA